MRFDQYAPISTLAVVSAGLGVLTALGFLIPELGLVSILGAITGYLAVIAIRQYELDGKQLARLGLITSITFAVAAPLGQMMAFRWEAPAGYLRLSFQTLNKRGADAYDEFVGEDICLKGYLHYPGARAKKDQFVLSTSPGFTSFGSFRWDQAIAVELAPGEVWDWHSQRVAVSGTLEFIPRRHRLAESPKYLLKNATVRRSLSAYDTDGRSSNGC